MIIAKQDILALLEKLSQDQTVFVPGFENGISRFVAWQPGVVARFDLQNTKEPPKEKLFPATEKMYRWKRHEGELTIEQAAVANQPFVLFGVKPCDVASIDRLDAVFLTKGYTDEFYEARRNAATIVAMTCTTVAPTCFCTSMQGDPGSAPNADVLLRDAGDSYVVEAQTDKGRETVAAWGLDADKALEPIPAGECTLEVTMDGVADKLHGMFEHDIWQKVADTCIQCGTCTFVCPTCYCFDISQDRRLNEGNRFRCWDSCMFTEYTAMAGGHNPRATTRQRVRQRFMHKLCYFEDRYGSGLCVGCGRCIADCPAHVDITSIIDEIGVADV